MTDDAHHMSLLTLLIQGVAHRLAVDGQTLISRAIDFVPALQGLVQMRGGDADQHIAQDVLAGHDITTLFATAAKALSRFLPQALRPIRDGLVTAHPAHHGPRGDPQHHGQTMAPPLCPTYIQFAARYTVPRWRCGSTKVSSNTTPCPKASSQSPGKRL